ncbi:MAG: hypothetical protein JW768_00220 [Chitinispirillaceae bacterium]|nr:hypothetical protein [Chitinispirillaceae bacterium]
MATTVNSRGASNSSSRPIHSVVKGIGPNSSITSTVEGTGDPNKRIMSDIAPVEVKRTKNIDPISAHIKEVNHIDPVTIESLRVSTVRDIEPLRVEEVNVTTIPTLNHTVRHMPAMDMSVRRVPPMSVGVHQRFEVPSDYTMRATVLGFEVARISLKGTSWIIPHQVNKPERHIEKNRSYPVEAVAGNPSIPVNCRVKTFAIQPVPFSGHHPTASRNSVNKNIQMAPRPASAGAAGSVNTGGIHA